MLAKIFNGLDRFSESKEYLPVTTRPFRAGQPVWTDWDTDRGIREGFKASAWVYRCVNISVDLGSTVPFGVQRRNANGEWEFDWGNQISEVLNYWNDDFGQQESIGRLISYLLLGGNALTGKFFSGSRLMEIRPESPAGVEVIPDAMGGIDHYDYIDGNGVKGRWEREDLCHGRLIDPFNPLWGLSRLKAIAMAIDTDVEAQRWNKRRLEVGGVPDGILTDSSIKREDQRVDAQLAIDAQWGRVSGPWVQGEGIGWTQMGLTQKDLDWLEGRRFSMREIIIGFGYHPALFGEDAIFNNSRVAEKIKWTGAILPILRIIVDSLTRGLIPKEQRGKFRVWYDVSGVEALHEEKNDKIDAFVKLIQNGTPWNRARSLMRLDMPDLPNGLGEVPMFDSRFNTLASMIDRSTDPNQPL